MKKVLVLCTGNSCRSQIAEGYLPDPAKSADMEEFRRVRTLIKDYCEKFVEENLKPHGTI